MKWPVIPSFLKNKYFIAFLVVFTWVLFFDKHNLLRHYRTHREIKGLRQEKAFYMEEIERDSLAIDKLTNDPDALERYARERYMMKREGEDIFIIVEE